MQCSDASLNRWFGWMDGDDREGTLNCFCHSWRRRDAISLHWSRKTSRRLVASEPPSSVHRVSGTSWIFKRKTQLSCACMHLCTALIEMLLVYLFFYSTSTLRFWIWFVPCTLCCGALVIIVPFVNVSSCPGNCGSTFLGMHFFFCCTYFRSV